MLCRKTSGSGTVAKFSPCASPLLRCLGDSYLQVSNIPVHLGPVDAVPFDQVCRRRRCRLLDKTLPVVELHSHLLSPLEIPSKKTQVSPCGDIAFPAGKIHRNFHRRTARRDHVEVSALSREATFKPLSRPLQPGVRFFHDPLPALPTASLTIGLPAVLCGRRYGLTLFHSSNRNSLGPAFPPVALRRRVPV